MLYSMNIPPESYIVRLRYKYVWQIKFDEGNELLLFEGLGENGNGKLELETLAKKFLNENKGETSE